MWAAGGELLVNLDHSAGGHWLANEPVVAEVSPDHLLMLMRTPLGRLFQSWSSDNGTSWSKPEPTALASALGPASLERIPGTDDLLVVWNQASRHEIERGLSRHRLSTAISKDGGTTWLHGRNIFSIYRELDRTYVKPPPIGNYRATELSPKLPANNAQGTYPIVNFWKDRAIVRFGCSGLTPRGPDTPKAAGRLTAESGWIARGIAISLPVSWFYQDLRPFG